VGIKEKPFEGKELKIEVIYYPQESRKNQKKEGTVSLSPLSESSDTITD